MASPALADVKSGVDAWSRGDFAAAVAEWLGPATQGDADAQFNLAQAYRLGRGVKADLAKAEDLFSKAAAQGHLHASDNYGLLLFQRGERAKALPYISAAADRGEPRAQYLLGIANFNGDNVPKDWVRAYALVSLAQQQGVQQAVAALSQMDQFIPLEQRQKSVVLAQELSSQAQATRARQLAAVDLGNSIPTAPMTPVVTSQPRVRPGVAVAAPVAPAVVVPVPPKPPIAAALPAPAVVRPLPPAIAPKPAEVPSIAPPAAAAMAGAWRVQLGAFNQRSNAEAMWNRVKGRPEITGHAKLLIPAGRFAKLQVGGYASQAAAQAACTRLAAAGIACLAVQN